jgi:hypothetical protein
MCVGGSRDDAAGASYFVMSHDLSWAGGLLFRRAFRIVPFSVNGCVFVQNGWIDDAALPSAVAPNISRDAARTSNRYASAPKPCKGELASGIRESLCLAQGQSSRRDTSTPTLSPA